MNGPDGVYDYFQQESALMKDAIRTHVLSLETRNRRQPTSATIVVSERIPPSGDGDLELCCADDTDSRFVSNATANTCTSIFARLRDIDEKDAGPM